MQDDVTASNVTHTDLWFAAHFTEQFVIFEFLALIRHDTGHSWTDPILKEYLDSPSTFKTTTIFTHIPLLRRRSYYWLGHPFTTVVLLTEPTLTSFLIGRFISGCAIYGNSRLFPDDVGNCRKLWICKYNRIWLWLPCTVICCAVSVWIIRKARNANYRWNNRPWRLKSSMLVNR